MVTTYLRYQFYAKNLGQSMQRVANEPMVKREEKYYNDNIGKVKTVDDFLKDYRLYSFAMKSYGLSDMIQSKAFMRKVLTSDVTDSTSFANRLQDKRFKEFAAAFNFTTKGTVATATKAVQSEAQEVEIEGLYSRSAAAANMTASAVTTEKNYYTLRLDTISDASEMISDTRMYNFILNAHGLDPAKEDSATILKVLKSDVSDPKSFANTSKNAKYIALAADFNFTATGKVTTVRTPQNNFDIKSTVTNYMSNTASGSVAQTAAKTEASYYVDAIAAVDNVDEFLADSRLLAVAKRAFGLEGATVSTETLRKVLTSDLSDRSSYANTSGDERFRNLAANYNFTTNGSIRRTTTEVQSKNDLAVTRANYERQQIEGKAGEESEALRLALYFQRNAPKLTSTYGILADKAMIKVVQTALNIPAETSKMDIDKQVAMIEKRLKVSDLRDPAKLEKFIARFTALYDVANNDTTGSSSTGSSVASSILGG